MFQNTIVFSLGSTEEALLFAILCLVLALLHKLVLRRPVAFSSYSDK